MDNSLTQELITMVQKWRKLIHKIHSMNNAPVYPGEFMMLNTIYVMLYGHKDSKGFSCHFHGENQQGNINNLDNHKNEEFFIGKHRNIKLDEFNEDSQIEEREEHNSKAGIKVSDLTNKLCSTKSATSKMLKNLEDKGYITRITDTKDRRVVYINLTESGMAIVKDSFLKMHHLSEQAIAKLGEDDAKELVRILNKFYEAMDTELIDSHK